MTSLLIKPESHVFFYYKEHSAAFEGDSGIDLFFPSTINVKGNSNVLVDLEVKLNMKQNEEDVSFYVYPRSSISKTPLRMANSVGIIDSKYRHNIKVSIDNISSEDYVIKRGDRLFQVCAPDLSCIKTKIVSSLEATTRGEGFGSSN